MNEFQAIVQSELDKLVARFSNLGINASGSTEMSKVSKSCILAVLDVKYVNGNAYRFAINVGHINEHRDHVLRPYIKNVLYKGFLNRVVDRAEV